MGVDGVLVNPCLLLGGQAREVELAHGDHGVAALPAHVVAVDLHAGVEAVVEARLLELLDGLRDDLRVKQAHLGGEGLGVELPGRGRGGRVVVRLIVDVLQAVGGQRGVDVALNVGRFEAALVGTHAELLDESRVGAGQDEGGNNGDGHAGDGQAPRTAEGCNDEEDRDEAGDDRQNGVCGQRRVDIGVHGAVDRPGVRGEQLVATQPVVHADEERQAGGHHAGLQARLLRGVGARSQADRSVQVGHDEGRDEGDGGDGQQEGHEDLQRGQDEHEERDVQAELGINLIEGRAVEELEQRLPLRGQASAVRETEEQSDAPERESAHGLESLLVGAQGGRVLPARRGGAMPVRVGHREENECRGHDETDDEQADVRSPLGEDDAGGAHLAEPQDLGPHDRCAVNNRADRDQDAQSDRSGAGLMHLQLDGRAIGVSRRTRSPRGEDRKIEAHGSPLCKTDRLQSSVAAHMHFFVSVLFALREIMGL